MGRGRILNIFTLSDSSNLFPELRKSIVALMVKAANLDGIMDAAEQNLIHILIEEKTGLSPDESQTLLAQTTKAMHQDKELHEMAKELGDSLSEEDRASLLGMLWKVVYADGVLHDYEADQVQRSVVALDLPNEVSSLVRRRAQSQMGITTGLI